MIHVVLPIFCAVLVWVESANVQTTYAMEVPSEAKDYLEASPITLESFLQHPLKTLWKMISDNLFSHEREIFELAKRMFGLLLCAAAFKFLVGDSRWDTLLEWVFACGCFLLTETSLVQISQAITEKSTLWKDFLYGFTPVFAASMIASGQVGAATVCNGFFLSAIGLVAGILQSMILPATRLFLAITVAGIFSENHMAESFSVRIGKILSRVIRWIGGIFAALMGIQRVFTGVTDNAAMQAGKSILFSSIPIVGQAITSAAGGIMASVKMLQGGLAFSALAIVGAECLPLYIQTMLCWCIFTLAALAASLLGLPRCSDMLNGMASGAYVLAAVLALYFGMLAVGILMMLVLGGGGA